MSESILIIVATITEVDDEGVAFVREDTWLVPALVACLMRYSKPVFEEDISLEDAKEEAQLRYAMTVKLSISLMLRGMCV